MTLIRRANAVLSAFPRRKDWFACEPSRFLEEMPEAELVYAGGHADAVPTVTKDEGMDKLARLKAMLGKPVTE